MQKQNTCWSEKCLKQIPEIKHEKQRGIPQLPQNSLNKTSSPVENSIS